MVALPLAELSPGFPLILETSPIPILVCRISGESCNFLVAGHVKRKFQALPPRPLAPRTGCLQHLSVDGCRDGPADTSDKALLEQAENQLL